MCFVAFFWKQLFTWLTVCPRIQYVSEPKVWLKFCFVFFHLGFLDGTLVLIVPVLYHCLASCFIHSNLKPNKGMQKEWQ